MTYNTMEIIWVLFSFLVTWGLGMSPSLLIRYLFVKKPLKKSTASWVAGAISVFFFLGFRVLFVLLGVADSATGGAVWFVMFFVSRAILTKEKNNKIKNIHNKPKEIKVDETKTVKGYRKQ